MPISQNINEAGWFYHAPAKKQEVVERVEACAPSQIPGIGFDDPTLYEKEEVRPVMFKETDTKYIQMAKLGGRKDLLSFNPNKYNSKSENGRGYNRNEWFYLEDNRVEDEHKKKEESWDFLLPEYMVHKGYQPSFENPATPPSRSGAPFYVDKNVSVMDEGRSATDKTVKIPEVRRAGFGVRNEKPPPAMKSLPPREKPANANKQNKKNNAFDMPSETQEPTNMLKLLGGGYERDWHTKRDEYESKKVPAGKPSQSNEHTAPRSQGNSAVQRNNINNNFDSNEKGEPFIMNKFKNIPSKVDTHQRPEVLPAHCK